MERLSTTVLAVVGAEADTCLRSFGTARNVQTVRTTGMAPTDPTERAELAWRRSVRSRSTFTMHDADPLEPVAEAWVATFEGAPRGNLEMAISATLDLWRRGAIGMPDFYLVLRPDELPPGRRDWYLGVLHRAAPARVKPVEAEYEVVRAAIGSLGSGRWWPDLTKMLEGLELALPDQLMVASIDTVETNELFHR